jgi:hypothetical protein
MLLFFFTRFDLVIHIASAHSLKSINFMQFTAFLPFFCK